MIKFEHVAGPFGDCTSRYKLSFDKPYTISEFIEEILQNKDEYGEIYIGENYIKPKDTCSYAYGNLRSRFNDRYLNRKIISAKASGGWGCMDYYLNLKANDMVLKYIKKPIIVEAYQTDKEVLIPTPEGVMKASPGDYIITGIKGERYPCKPDIFEATYEPYEEPPKKMSKKDIMRRNAELNESRRKRLNQG